MEIRAFDGDEPKGCVMLRGRKRSVVPSRSSPVVPRRPLSLSSRPGSDKVTAPGRAFSMAVAYGRNPSTSMSWSGAGFGQENARDSNLPDESHL